MPRHLQLAGKLLWRGRAGVRPLLNKKGSVGRPWETQEEGDLMENIYICTTETRREAGHLEKRKLKPIDRSNKVSYFAGFWGTCMDPTNIWRDRSLGDLSACIRSILLYYYSHHTCKSRQSYRPAPLDWLNLSRADLPPGPVDFAPQIVSIAVLLVQSILIMLIIQMVTCVLEVFSFQSLLTWFVIGIYYSQEWGSRRCPEFMRRKEILRTAEGIYAY